LHAASIVVRAGQCDRPALRILGRSACSRRPHKIKERGGLTMRMTRCQVAALAALTLTVAGSGPSVAQSADVKEKPALYTYVANWTLPRARWPELEKATAANQKVMDKAVAAGTLVGYGDDSTLVHRDEGTTHDSWWSSMSMAGIFNTLDDLYKSGNVTSAVLASATKHSDSLYVSHYYNWKAGSWKGAYTHSADYSLKPDAPNDAIDTLAQTFIVPMMEKLLAEGTVIEYEIDVEAIHTESPNSFTIIYLTPTAEGLDKVNAAVRDSFAKLKLVGPAMDSMIDFSKHRDGLALTSATYK
jgi:hypothetical protein